MKQYPEERKKGFIVGSNRGVENQIIEHFSLHNYDIHYKESISSVLHLISKQSYAFIIVIDRNGDESSLDNIRYLSEIVFGKKIVVMVENGGMKKFMKYELKNVYGYLSIDTTVFILQFLIEAILIAGQAKDCQAGESRLPNKFRDLCFN